MGALAITSPVDVPMWAFHTRALHCAVCGAHDAPILIHNQHHCFTCARWFRTTERSLTNARKRRRLDSLRSDIAAAVGAIAEPKRWVVSLERGSPIGSERRLRWSVRAATAEHAAELLGRVVPFAGEPASIRRARWDGQSVDIRRCAAADRALEARS